MIFNGNSEIHIHHQQHKYVTIKWLLTYVIKISHIYGNYDHI
jgi:hypothetical protein